MPGLGSPESFAPGGHAWRSGAPPRPTTGASPERVMQFFYKLTLIALSTMSALVRERLLSGR
jgi:hypothetical protein